MFRAWNVCCRSSFGPRSMILSVVIVNLNFVLREYVFVQSFRWPSSPLPQFFVLGSRALRMYDLNKLSSIVISIWEANIDCASLFKLGVRRVSCSHFLNSNSMWGGRGDSSVQIGVVILLPYLGMCYHIWTFVLPYLRMCYHIWAFVLPYLGICVTIFGHLCYHIRSFVLPYLWRTFFFFFFRSSNRQEDFVYLRTLNEYCQTGRHSQHDQLAPGR